MKTKVGISILSLVAALGCDNGTKNSGSPVLLRPPTAEEKAEAYKFAGDLVETDINSVLASLLQKTIDLELAVKERTLLATQHAEISDRYDGLERKLDQLERTKGFTKDRHKELTTELQNIHHDAFDYSWRPAQLASQMENILSSFKISIAALQENCKNGRSDKTFVRKHEVDLTDKEIVVFYQEQCKEKVSSLEPFQNIAERLTAVTGKQLRTKSIEELKNINHESIFPHLLKTKKFSSEDRDILLAFATVTIDQAISLPDSGIYKSFSVRQAEVSKKLEAGYNTIQKP